MSTRYHRRRPRSGCAARRCALTHGSARGATINGAVEWPGLDLPLALPSARRARIAAGSTECPKKMCMTTTGARPARRTACISALFTRRRANNGRGASCGTGGPWPLWSRPCCSLGTPRFRCHEGAANRRSRDTISRRSVEQLACACARDLRTVSSLSLAGTCKPSYLVLLMQCFHCAQVSQPAQGCSACHFEWRAAGCGRPCGAQVALLPPVQDGVTAPVATGGGGRL